MPELSVLCIPMSGSVPRASCAVMLARSFERQFCASFSWASHSSAADGLRHRFELLFGVEELCQLRKTSAGGVAQTLAKSEAWGQGSNFHSCSFFLNPRLPQALNVLTCRTELSCCVAIYNLIFDSIRTPRTNSPTSRGGLRTMGPHQDNNQPCTACTQIC